jgi:hypothetical protein
MSTEAFDSTEPQPADVLALDDGDRLYDGGYTHG